MNLKELIEQDKPFLFGVLPEEINAERIATYVLIDSDSNSHSDSIYLSEFPSTLIKKSISPSQAEYEKLVSHAVETIKTTSLKKVVTSRIKSVNTAIDKIELFNKMSTAYRFAFVYVLRLANGEYWMGATPELLLRKRGNHYRTVSLAGTQKLIPDMPLEQYSWGDKEIVEQQLVTDFITIELENAGCRDIEFSDPFTSAAGVLVHRKSFINFRSDLSIDQLVQILHPTPAICGLPRKEALDFIHKYEPHSRSFYSGVIGYEYLNGDVDLFVNLRCMRINHDHADVFVGGGITADSDPEKEWQETELKSKTLLGLLEF